MRLDHIAYRVKNRYKTAKFFEATLSYTIGTKFQIEFDDESTADCLALVPPEERHPETRLWEYKQFNNQVTDWERKRYFEII